MPGGLYLDIHHDLLVVSVCDIMKDQGTAFQAIFLACITAHILVTIVPSMYAVTYIASDVYSLPG